MNRDTIIRMAREAGLTPPPLDWPQKYAEALERFAALVEAHLKSQGWRQCAKGQKTTQFCGMVEQAIQAEREACAKVCEARYMGDNSREDMEAKRCAAAIRSRT